jgi:hypothetical protein
VTVLDDLVTVRKSAGFTRVYKIGEVPANPTYPYAVMGYAPDAPLVRSLTGDGKRLDRFTVQHFGRTADSVADVADQSFALFDGKHLPLTDSPMAWQEIATLPDRDADDYGVLGITHTYRF